MPSGGCSSCACPRSLLEKTESPPPPPPHHHTHTHAHTHTHTHTHTVTHQKKLTLVHDRLVAALDQLDQPLADEVHILMTLIRWYVAITSRLDQFASFRSWFVFVFVFVFVFSNPSVVNFFCPKHGVVCVSVCVCVRIISDKEAQPIFLPEAAKDLMTEMCEFTVMTEDPENSEARVIFEFFRVVATHVSWCPDCGPDSIILPYNGFAFFFVPSNFSRIFESL
jgi:hypothetical protein